MRLLDYYKATFPGEIFEKTKRKLLISTNLFSENKKKIPENILISDMFLYSKKNKNFKKLDDSFKIFNLKINLLKDVGWDILEADKDKEWYKVKISDYRDIKYTWEVNRLQFLLPLAINKNQERGIEILDSWIENNKVSKGPNWCSNLEVAIRSISILNFINFIDDLGIIEKYKKILYEHAQHIYTDIFYTEKCIPNNHLVGEASALYCLSRFFESDESLKWEKKSKKILKKYLEHIRDDGTYIEASLSYHRFFIQMYIMVYLYSIKTNDFFLENEIKEMVKKSFVFFKSIEKPNGEYPDFGDNDEGYFYKIFGEQSFVGFVDDLEYILNRSEIKDTNELKFLFENIYNLKMEESKKIKLNLKNIFLNGKYFAHKKNKDYIFFNNQDQIYHSHSDGLSIEVMLGGQDILVDSGTFNYNINKNKRRYYRGTTSHNTILLDKLDQSTQIGSFRWINQAKSDLKSENINQETITVQGELQTKNSSKHLRKIELDKNFDFIKIVDKIENVKELELNWHFAKGIQLEKINENEYLLLGTKYKLRIECDFISEISIKESPCSIAYGEEHLRKNIKVINKEKKDIYTIKTLIKRDE